MCLIALGLKQVPGAAVVVAANREEEFARQATPPQIQSGSPRVICGTDLLAGGTWLGVNQHGLLAAVTNRRKTQLPSDPRSRGKLCRDLLAIDTAEQAASLAWDELASERYAGVNVVCADAGRAYCLHGGDRLEVREMSDGWFVLTNGALDDPQDLRLSRARRLLTAEPAAQFRPALSCLPTTQDNPSTCTRRDRRIRPSTRTTRRNCAKCWCFVRCNQIEQVSDQRLAIENRRQYRIGKRRSEALVCLAGENSGAHRN